MMKELKIGVGSLNPVKIAAVETKCAQVWPNCQVIGATVPSGVSDMPLNDADCIQGARHRALAVRERLDADFGFGLEGGVMQEPHGLMLVGWVAVVNRQGATGLAGAPRLLLPNWIAQRVLAGEELGPLMDEITKETNSKQKRGAAGILSGGLTNRHEAFAIAVAYALSPFVVPQFYSPV